MLDIKFAEKCEQAETFINNGGAEMVEMLKEKVVKISEYVNMVISLDLLLLDDNTNDSRLVEQVGCEQYITDIERLNAHVENVRIHLESGLLMQRDLEDIRELHQDVKSMVEEVNYLVSKNERLTSGFGWTGVHENTL